jgi:integrase
MTTDTAPPIAPKLASDQQHNPTGKQSHGVYYRTCREDIVAEVEGYRSASEDWSEVSGLVRDVVARAAESTSLPARRLMRVVGPFVLWCVAAQGLPQQVSALFNPKVIDAYCSSRRLSAATIATYRSALTSTSRVVNEAAYGRAPKPLAKRTVQGPYTDAEMDRFRLWADGQRTELLRQKARTMVALMAGAGLSPVEAITLRVKDVHIDSEGVLLTVGGEKARRVAVLATWEQLLIDALAGRPATAFVWGSPERRVHANLIGEFTSSTSGLPPTSHRLRATWIVTHLTLGTPLKALFRAGGIAKLDNLDQYLLYVPDRDDADARALLRGVTR